MKFWKLLMGTDIKVLPPKIIYVDFEKAILNSIKKIFKNIQTGGCYFHLAQNLWENIQKQGLASLYSNDKSIRESHRSLKALAFVPSEHVASAFKLIKKNCPTEMEVIFENFETFYIGKLKKNSKSERESPTYPIEIWNCYERVLNGMATTNNAIESWHKQFADSTHSHPTIGKLIDTMLNEQVKTEYVITQMDAGDGPKRKTASLLKEERILNCCKRFKLDKLEKFITNIISNLID